MSNIKFKDKARSEDICQLIQKLVSANIQSSCFNSLVTAEKTLCK